MKLTILGASAARPNGGDASSGYLVQSETTAIMLDCGSGVVSQLQAVCDPRRLDAVVISHLHSDHTLDLVALRYGLKYAPPGPIAPIPLHMPPDGTDFLARLGAVFAIGAEAHSDFWADTLSIREYRDHLERGEPLVIGDLTLHFAPMQHYVPAWAIRVEEAGTGRSLTYSADTGPAGPLAEFAAGCDLLLCEATLLAQSPGSDPAHWGHLTATEAGEIATAAGVKQLVLTHLWEELGFEQYLADARAAFPGEVARARSGMVFTLRGDNLP
jgi:ribonuclease BN (tRNA processing enzyme)